MCRICKRSPVNIEYFYLIIFLDRTDKTSHIYIVVLVSLSYFFENKTFSDHYHDYCSLNLFQYIEENGKFTEINPFLDIFLTILDILSFLHGEKNIAHRDLKPENILLDKDNHPKICDLGMAKFVGKGNQTVYRGNEGGMGTPGYIPPEVILLKKGQRI